MKTKEFIKEFFAGALNVLYPVKCCCCGCITRNSEDICPDCRKSLEYIDLDKRCKYCGREKSDCDCKIYVHRYKELLAVFKYEGNAKKIMLRYKMYSKRHYADFFAKEMALCIGQEYRDYPINTVCYVPVSVNSYRKRGYNQSRMLARKIAGYYHLELCSALKTGKSRRPQHKSKSREERLRNAQYKYKCEKDMTGKTVLLVDDIATTGATLDDCTRALLFAGATEVYCAVAMVTSLKKDK